MSPLTTGDHRPGPRLDQVSRRSVLKGMTLLAGSPLLVACGGGGGEGGKNDLRMSWWGAEDRHKKTLALIDLYEKKNPGIKITAQYGGLQGYQDKMSTEMAGGNGPDILQLPNRLPFIESGSLLQLDQFVPDVIDLSTANKSVIDASKVDGKLYGLPWGLATGAMFYDTTVFQQAGVAPPGYDWTWDDFADIAKRLAKAAPKGAYGAADIWAPAGTGSFAPFEMFLRQRKKQPYSEDGKLAFEKADLTEWFSFWDDLRRAGAVTPAEITALESGYETSPLITGKAAIYPINSSIASSLQALAKHPLGITTLPNGKGSSALTGTVFGQYINSSIMIYGNARSKNTQQVAQFINFIINDPDAAKIHLMARGVPLSSKMTALVEPSVSPAEKQMIKLINYVQTHGTERVIAAPAKSSQVPDLMNRSHQEIAFGRADVAGTVDKFFSEAERLLA